MKKLTFWKSLFLLCALVVGNSSAWGATYTGTFTKITSQADFVTGYYVVTGAGTAKALGSTVNNKNRIPAVNVTISSNSITNPDDAVVYYITRSSSTCTFKNVNTSKYMYQSSTTSGQGMAFKNASENITFTAYNNGFEFTLNGASNNIFKYNNSSSWFANYTGNYDAGMLRVDLYKLEVEKTDPTITFNDGSVHAGKTLDLSTLFTSNSLGAVTYTVTSGGTYASVEGNILTGLAEGSATVKAAQAAAGDYNAGVKTATITVNPALVLSSIAVTTSPTKTTYTEGETFDPTGMVVTATYADESTDDVTTACTFTPSGALTTSDTEITISYTENSVNKTTTQAITVNEVIDYVTLPFSWEGGVKNDLLAIDGVEATGLGSDYAAGNAPYRIKLDDTGDNIRIKTNVQPDKVTIGVKMLGGASTSTITVQESADGKTFTDVEDLTISGSQDDVLNLLTTENFSNTTRYLKFVFTKGSNVGVGPITITGCEAVTITSAEYATYCNATQALNFSETGIKVYTATDMGSYVKLNEIDGGQVPANTPVVLYKSGADGTAINVPVIASAAAIQGTNDLRVSTGTDVANMFVLAKKNNKVGFYKWAGSNLSAGKVYLLGQTTNARDFIGFDETTTGIANLNVDVNDNFDDNAPMYNLAGQRVNKSYKGVVIVNGKKVVRK